MSTRTATAAAAFLVASGCKGPPARLVAGSSDTVVVSSSRPVQISARVFDAAGHALQATGVRYRWTSGISVPVSAAGTVTRAQSGDATVRASLGEVATSVLVLCRPVRDLRMSSMVQLVLGDSAQVLPVEALGVDGRPVALFAGSAAVDDSTIATLDGLRIRPRSPGNTLVEVRVGEHSTRVGVSVYERVSTLEGLRPQQRYVIVPVRLASGEMRRWRISPGLYMLSILPDRSAGPVPKLAIVGANCTPPDWEQRIFCLARGDASVIVYHPWRAGITSELNGELTLAHLRDP